MRREYKNKINFVSKCGPWHHFKVKGNNLDLLNLSHTIYNKLTYSEAVNTKLLRTLTELIGHRCALNSANFSNVFMFQNLR